MAREDRLVFSGVSLTSGYSDVFSCVLFRLTLQRVRRLLFTRHWNQKHTLLLESGCEVILETFH
jgi:hypothetical protein